VSDGLRFWSGTLLGASLDAHLVAASAGGFSDLSLFPLDYTTARASGMSDRELRSRIDDSGLRVAVIDPLTTWVPDWTPPAGVPQENLAFGDYSTDEVLRQAVVLGAHTISAIELWGNAVDLDQGAERLASLCDRAAEHGLRVQVEFIPFSGIPTLREAWELVRRADRTNAGIVFDTWHWYRGDNDEALLREIPGDRIFAVQVSDGPSSGEEDLLDECLHRRLLPGEGEMDLTRVLRLLRDSGATPSYGVEVFSDALLEQDPAYVGRRTAGALRSLLP